MVLGNYTECVPSSALNDWMNRSLQAQWQLDDTLELKNVSNMNTENRLTRLYHLLDEALSDGRAKVVATLRKEIAQVEAAEKAAREQRKKDDEAFYRARAEEVRAEQSAAEAAELKELRAYKKCLEGLRVDDDVPDYAPAFVKGTIVGLVLSAVFTALGYFLH